MKKTPFHDSVRFYPGWHFFFFFYLILYTLWWHKPRFGDSWENIWGLVLLLILAYITLSFTIQVILFTGRLSRKELSHSLSFPKILAPKEMQLQHTEQSLILEIQMPNILFGIQIFWELKLYDTQLRKTIRFRHRLNSGKNRIHLPLDELIGHKKLLKQLQRGYYRGKSQTFFVRDCFSCLHMHYHIKQALKLAVLPKLSPPSDSLILPDSHSRAQLDTVIHKLAQESLHEQRPYYPGDDPRRINWKLYSRFNELYVRIPEEEQLHSQDIHYYLLLDMTCYPKSLHSSVLDSATTFFLSQVKQLYQNGSRVIVHMPQNASPYSADTAGATGIDRNQSQNRFTHGVLYNEESEEQIITALAAYPLDSSIPEPHLPHSQKSYDSRNSPSATAATPVQNAMAQMLETIEASSNNSHIVFHSPHSTSYASGSNVLEKYFPKNQSIFIPVPEPSNTLEEELRSGSAFKLFKLLPKSIFWSWLLRSSTPELLSEDSYRFYQKMGIATVASENEYRSLQNISYLRLLLHLAAWRNYYKKPDKRYLIGKKLRAS